MRALFLLSLLLAQLLASAAQVVPYCQATLTYPRIARCIECNQKKCYYCNHLSSPIWTGTTTAPILSECRPLTFGNANCKDIHPQCQVCERISGGFAANKCIRCIPEYGVVNGKCAKVVGTTVDIRPNCRAASMNPDCWECHPDATCKICPGEKPFLSPTNTIWLDAGYPETQCTLKSTIAVQSKAIAGVDLMATNAVATFCRELDTDFRCAACAAWNSIEKRGYGPVKTADPNKIDCQPNDGTVVKDAVTLKPVASTTTQPIGRNGCYMKLPFMQYCLKCTDDGRKCLATKNGIAFGCTGGRSIDPNTGLCSLNCKGMFGIGCKACNYFNCLVLDTAYASGR